MSTLPASDWVVPVPDWPGFRMFPQEPNVCGGANAVRVPPRARVFPGQGPFLRSFGVHIVHTLASDLMFRVCGVPDLFGCVGEQLSTAGRIPPCGVSSGRSSSFVLPLGFGVHQFMVARAVYNMTCSSIL